MKVTVIGAGSTYTPELVSGFLKRVETPAQPYQSFPLSELCLMDIDPQRLQIVGGFAQRMAAAHGSPFRVTLTTDQRQAVQEATYVVTQLRVGMMPARREDEYLGLRHGLIGQETTGVGGMAKALRTIPVILGIAEDMRQLAPGAPSRPGEHRPQGPMLVNFTNPAGLVTEALSRHAPDIPSVGVCNVGITTKMHLLETAEKLLGRPIAPERAQLQTLGLNHLTWHSGFTVDGEELWPHIFGGYLDEIRNDPDPEWTVETLESLGMIPNYYLQYFYYTQKKLNAQKRWPPSRAEEVMAIEADLLRLYADPSLSEPPPELMKRGGAYYSTLATELLNSHYNDLGQVHVVNVPNRGAAPGWPDDWVIELPCRVDRQGIHPLPVKGLPESCSALVQQVKTYELYTVEAAVTGDREAALQALMAHPLGPRGTKREAQAVLDDLLETNRAYLPKFF
jgi:6-phospho-beta-glucosidase